MRTYFERLSRPELDFLIDNCIFSKEEIKILEMILDDKSDQQIADCLKVSTSFITKKKNKIKTKIFDFLEVSDFVTVIYVNGEKVTKDNLKNFEIQIDAVKGIIKDKLTGKK